MGIATMTGAGIAALTLALPPVNSMMYRETSAGRIDVVSNKIVCPNHGDRVGAQFVRKGVKACGLIQPTGMAIVEWPSGKEMYDMDADFTLTPKGAAKAAE